MWGEFCDIYSPNAEKKENELINKTYYKIRYKKRVFGDNEFMHCFKDLERAQIFKEILLEEGAGYVKIFKITEKEEFIE